jgi:hypothetical protein
MGLGWLFGDPRTARSWLCRLGLHPWCPATVPGGGQCGCRCRHGEAGEE